jgi:hypothetical protein
VSALDMPEIERRGDWLPRSRGWLCLPFEAVRRRGQFFVRAEGLKEVFPEDFERSATGDYFASKWQNGHGYIRQSEAAIAFAKFLRNRLLCAGSLHRRGDPRAARVDWEFWGLANFRRPAALRDEPGKIWVATSQSQGVQRAAGTISGAVSLGPVAGQSVSGQPCLVGRPLARFTDAANFQGFAAPDSFSPRAAQAESVAVNSLDQAKRKLRETHQLPGRADGESRSGTGTSGSVVQRTTPGRGRKPARAQRACRRCGCTQERPCEDLRLCDYCSWVERDLCSACLSAPEFKRFMASHKRPSLGK